MARRWWLPRPRPRRFRSSSEWALTQSQTGLVASLNRPGGNLTGIAILAAQLAPKRLQLLRELIPNAAVYGFLADPAAPSIQSIITDLQAAARTLSLQACCCECQNRRRSRNGLRNFLQQRVGAVLVGNSAFYSRRTEQLAALAARHALPAIYPYREYALAGGLMSHGSSLSYTLHQVGIYTGRILKGENPADLPVQQVTKIELVINANTAKALALPSQKRCWPLPDEAIE